MPNYPKSYILIDPDYRGEKTYHKHFDYDLLGHRIGVAQDFLRNPVGFLQNSVESYQVEILISLFSVFGFFITMAIFKILLKKLVDLMKLTLKIVLQGLKARSMFKKNIKAGLGENYDIYARAACRIFSLVHGIYSSKKNPVPETVTDYEAIRFVMAEPWISTFVYRALDNVDLTRPVDDEAIEGLAEDEKHGYLDIEEEEEAEVSEQDEWLGDISLTSEELERFVDADMDDELNAEGDAYFSEVYNDADEIPAEEQINQQEQRNVANINTNNLPQRTTQNKDGLDQFAINLAKFKRSSNFRENNLANRFSLHIPSTSTSEDETSES